MLFDRSVVWNKRGRKAAALFTAAALACMTAACGLLDHGSAGGGTGTVSGSGNAGGGTAAGTASQGIPADSVLYFKNDSGFARLRSDMASGDVPVECNVLYDVNGERPDVTVKDAASIREIYDRLSRVTVGEKSAENVTDSYHHITFHLRNDSYVSFYFEGEGLLCWGYDNYNVSGGESLWTYVRQVQDVAMEKQRQKEAAQSAAAGDTQQAAAKADGAAGTGTTDNAGRTVLDGKNPSAEDSADDGAESPGETTLAGGMPAGHSGSREVAAQSNAGELKQAELTAGGESSPGIMNVETIPDSGAYSDAPQQTIPVSAVQGETAPETQDALDGTQNVSAENAPAENVSAENAPVENAPAENVSAENVPAENVPAGQEDGQYASAENALAGGEDGQYASGVEKESVDSIDGTDPADIADGTDSAPVDINSAYTEIVRAYAAVLALDRTAFLEDYNKGLYDVSVPEEPQAGANGSTAQTGTEEPDGLTDGAEEEDEDILEADAEEEDEDIWEADAEEEDEDILEADAEEEDESSSQAGDAAGGNTAGGAAAADDAVKPDPRLNYEMLWEYFNHPEGSAVQYGLRDYNGDGTQELVIALSSEEYRVVWAGYTFDGKKAVPLFTGRNALAYRCNLYTLPDRTFMIHASGSAASGRDTIARIAAGGTGLEIIAEYEYDQLANGTLDHIGSSGRLTDEEFQARYWAVAKDPSENVTFLPVRADAQVQAKTAGTGTDAGTVPGAEEAPENP